MQPDTRYPELERYRCPDCPPAPRRCPWCSTDHAAVRAHVVLRLRLGLCRYCDDDAVEGLRLCAQHARRSSCSPAHANAGRPA